LRDPVPQAGHAAAGRQRRPLGKSPPFIFPVEKTGFGRTPRVKGDSPMMRLIAAAVLTACAAGCSTKPCVDGERTTAGFYSMSTRTSYDPCKQKCCEPG